MDKGEEGCPGPIRDKKGREDERGRREPQTKYVQGPKYSVTSLKVTTLVLYDNTEYKNVSNRLRIDQNV